MLKTEKDIIAEYNRNTGKRIVIYESDDIDGYGIPIDFYEYLIDNTIENINNKNE